MKTDQQVMYEAGLLAIIDTAHKAYIEGFIEGLNHVDSSEEHAEKEWQQSEVYAACVKVLKQYGMNCEQI